MSSDLKDKLFNYEATPPDRVWAEIDASFNNQRLSQKLSNFEEVPNNSVWARIKDVLDQQTAKVVPINRRIKFRYSVAAALLILSIGVTTLLVNNSSEKVVQISRVQRPNSSSAMQDPVSDPANGDVKRNDDPPQPVAYTSARINTSGAKKKTNSFSTSIPDYLQPQLLTLSIGAPKKLLIDIKEKIQQFNFLPADRYMVYTDVEGNSTKVPKKLFDAVHCANHDVACKQHLEQLQAQAAKASLSVDFTGFLEMVKQVQENQ
ncbi:MAG TPA: hypothetical protein VM368_00800 [Flavisolibacter sp.]|nr:hypothetical protein [Flavisolibacter sp.]